MKGAHSAASSIWQARTDTIILSWKILFTNANTPEVAQSRPKLINYLYIMNSVLKISSVCEWRVTSVPIIYNV